MATVPTRRLRERPPLRRPTELEIDQAREAFRLIDAARARVTVRDEDGVEAPAEIPPLAQTILQYVLAEMAEGHGLRMSPLRPLLTTFEAADLLGISPFAVSQLLDSGELPFQETGGLRRVGFRGPDGLPAEDL